MGRGTLEAPPERVYRALTDYGHWSEFMPFLKKSDALPQPDGSVLASHVMQLPAPTGERHFQVRFRQRVENGPAGRTWKIEWAYVPGSGNVEGHHGSWTLTSPEPGRTLAVLRLYTDPGGFSPHLGGRARHHRDDPLDLRRPAPARAAVAVRRPLS